MIARTLSLLLLVACGPGSVSLVEGSPADTDGDTDPDTDPDTEVPVPADCELFGVSIRDAAVIDHDSVVQGWSDGEAAEFTTLSINSDSACALDVRRGRVLADIQVGPTGYPDVVVCAGRGSVLEGEQGILERAVPMVLAGLPDDLPENGGDKLLEWGETATFAVNRVFDDLRVRTNAELTIDGDVDIHVLGELELNRGVLRLTEGSSLDLWVDGGAQVIWASRVNVEGDAGALRLHLADGATLNVDHGSHLGARIRAPEASVRVAGRGSTLRGTVQTHELAVEWGGRIAVPPELICSD